ncbi:MAG: M20/M25/M40 family metallo-hydrolase, partial [Rhodospirillales bacterium]|nr:M20/M25/M40 family metallo-hydrolase [Rhodospirillales bacterium]
PLHIVLSYDEEVGCLGAPGLIKRYRKDFPEALAAIIGEPTEMKLANAHKGIAAFETRITGKPGHSSNPGAGVNAINYAARCIKALEDIADDFRRGGKHPRFSPPHATLSVGTIEGGNAINIIAENCVIGWECRSVTGTEADEAIAKFEEYCRSRLVPEMQEGDAGAGIETRRTAHVPPLRSDGDNVAEELVRRLTGQNEAGVISFAAEAGLFQEAGIPAVIIGPGSIAQAHRADEYVSIDQLEECTLFIRRITGWAAA